MSHSETASPLGAHMKWWVIGGVVVVLVCAAAYLLWPDSTPKTPPVAEASHPSAATGPRTFVQTLEEGIRVDLADSSQTLVTFTSVRIEDGRTENYPAGARVIYIRLGAVQRMLGLTEVANGVGSRLFRRTFQAAPDIMAVYIDVVGPVADRYGHLYDAPWISFVMDRSTFAKIDWNGFDNGNLCEFLSHEHIFDSQSNTFCGTKGDL